MTDIERDMSQVTHRPGAERPGVTEYLLAMGHELRAPLNGVIGMSGLLLDSELTAQQRQYVRSVHSAGESLGAILNDILDLARVATARLIVEPIPFDLKSMIEETASVLTPRAAERGLALRVDLRPELPRHVIGDPGRTRQVLGNLVGHAVNGTSQGEIVIRVTADGESGERAWVRFTVEDTGIGIAAERLQRIFDEYVQVDASPYRSFGVTGLGLRLSAELVRLMGGDIGAESAPGRGSRFWFTLPLVIAEPATGSAASDQPSLQGGRALIVEADASSRTRFVEQFDAAGWDVAFVDDIDRVVNELREGAAIGNPYNACVFSHYAVRPVHAEIANRLKADPALAKVALVMITAVGSPGEGKKLWHAGFAAYLRRPVPSEEIREALLVLASAGPDGRTASLVTRHSLAEARNAQTFAVDGIDRMLASLGTVEGTRRALLIPVAELNGVAELLDQRGIAAEAATSFDHALALLGEGRYECIVVDARNRADLTADLAAIRSRLADRGAIPIVAVTDAWSDANQFLSIGVDEVWTWPATALQVDRSLARWQPRAEPEHPSVAERETAIEPEAVATVEPVAEPAIEPVAQATAVAEPAPAVPEAAAEPASTLEAEPIALPEVVALPETVALTEPNPVVAAVEAAPAEVILADGAATEAATAVVAAEVVAAEVTAAEGTGVEIVAAEVVASEPEGAPVAELPAVEPDAIAAVTSEIAATPESEVLPVEALAPVEAEAAVEPASAEAAPVVEAIVIPTSEIEVTFDAVVAASPLEGLTDAEWELHTPIAAIDGFLTTAADIEAPPVDAVIEAVDLAPPSADLLAPAVAEPETVIESVDLERPIVVEPVVAVADLVPTTAATAVDPIVEAASPEITIAVESVPEPATIAPVIDLASPESVAAVVEPAAVESTAVEPAVTPEAEVPAAAAEPEFQLIGNVPPAPTWAAPTPVPATPVVQVDLSLDPISPALLEQALTGGGFFTQYQIASFLREVPARIADIATAASRGDAGQAGQSLTSLSRLAGAVGAAQIAVVVDQMIADVDGGHLESAAARLGAIEHAFLDARQALELASPHGLPADAPAIGSAFADQLSPNRDGAGRALAQKLAASFAADAPKRVADLKAAVADADGDAVQRVAQTFKGMCGLIGAEWLAKLVALAEADARLKRVTHAERYLEHIDLELGRVLSHLERAQA